MIQQKTTDASPSRSQSAAEMNSQQLADELLRNWQALWFLPPSERMQRIDAIRKDMEFEQRQRGVEREMTCQTQ